MSKNVKTFRGFDLQKLRHFCIVKTKSHFYYLSVFCKLTFISSELQNNLKRRQISLAYCVLDNVNILLKR
jgi:hypothetical protein